MEDGDAQQLIELARDGAPLERQREALAGYLRGRGVSQAAVDVVLGQTRDGIALFEEEGGRSRLGGPPLLPAGETWPEDHGGRPLSFIAALDLEDLPHLDPLPAGGLLLVYWSHRFYEQERMDFVTATRTFHVPDGEPDEAATPEDAEPFGPIPLQGFLMPLPGSMSELEVPDDDADPLYEAADPLLMRLRHQLLGTSSNVQGPVLSEVAYWFEQGFPETRERYEESELRGEGWLLLAQFEEADGLTFGDAGVLYLVMPEADLRAGRFDRVMGIMQSA